MLPPSCLDVALLSYLCAKTFGKWCNLSSVNFPASEVLTGETTHKILFLSFRKFIFYQLKAWDIYILCEDNFGKATHTLNMFPNKNINKKYHCCGSGSGRIRSFCVTRIRKNTGSGSFIHKKTPEIQIFS